MNKADSQFLFDGEVKTITLNNGEMIKAEGKWVPFIIGAYNAYRYTRIAVGPIRNWIRIGRSYSKSGGYKTSSLRWGSNNHYRQSIGSTRLRNWNQRLHNSSISSRSWRTRDTGHFHFRRY